MSVPTPQPKALSPQPSLRIGLIGCGVVGTGVIQLLAEQADAYAQRLGRRLEVGKVLVRSVSASRDVRIDASLLTDDAEAFFADRSIEIIVEVAGGIDAARSYLRRAIESGRHVITANKALLAHHGAELFDLAHQHNVCIAFEASCGGTVPMLSAIKFGLSANRIDAIYGILNGTCNYILTQMDEAGWSYQQALADAQAKGFAEADPTMDVGGHDAGQKLAILASLAFGAAVTEADVQIEGIQRLEAADIQFARELGYVVKLLGIAERNCAGLLLRVQPCFVAADEPLAKVRHAFNALSVYGHASGHVMLYGKGAGRMPTAAAVVTDLLNVASGWYPLAFEQMRIWPNQQASLPATDETDVSTRYYLRVSAKDQPGVIAKIARVLGDHSISISAISQHESEHGEFVPLVITTSKTPERIVHRAAAELAELPVVQGTPMCIRIVEMPNG